MTANNAEVYVKKIGETKPVKAIACHNVIGTSNYERFLMGLMRNMGDDFYVDSAKADKIHDRMMTKRKES